MWWFIVFWMFRICWFCTQNAFSSLFIFSEHPIIRSKIISMDDHLKEVMMIYTHGLLKEVIVTNGQMKIKLIYRNFFIYTTYLNDYFFLNVNLNTIFILFVFYLSISKHWLLNALIYIEKVYINWKKVFDKFWVIFMTSDKFFKPIFLKKVISQ